MIYSLRSDLHTPGLDLEGSNQFIALCSVKTLMRSWVFCGYLQTYRPVDLALGHLEVYPHHTCCYSNSLPLLDHCCRCFLRNSGRWSEMLIQSSWRSLGDTNVLYVYRSLYFQQTGWAKTIISWDPRHVFATIDALLHLYYFLPFWVGDGPSNPSCRRFELGVATNSRIRCASSLACWPWHQIFEARRFRRCLQ